MQENYKKKLKFVRFNLKIKISKIRKFYLKKNKLSNIKENQGKFQANWFL